MTYKAAKRKLRLELALMWPFVAAGKLYGRLFRLEPRHNLFLFCPSGDIGGAPQVNIDILRCISDKNPLVIFSKKPRNNKFLERFQMEGVKVLDLHRTIDNKAYHFVNFFFRGVLAFWIGAAEEPVVFGGESLFFYKVIPHIRKDIRTIELCHLDTWFPYTIAFIDRIDFRIFSTQKLRERVTELYDRNEAAPQLYRRLYFVENTIDIPAYRKPEHQRLEVVFIGRGSPQKRVHLAAEIAKRMHEKNAPVHFSFVGDVENIIRTEDFPYCSFYGNVMEESRMESFYAKSDVLLMTSSFEGLPVVVMKMMAYGRVVLSTAINAIPDYIKHMQNGMLISATAEADIVNQAVQMLQLLVDDPALREKMGMESRKIAMEKFDRDLFCRQYRHFFFDPAEAINAAADWPVSASAPVIK
jgi:glycosyltransferase involved in cell wall biosynthesis